MKNKIIIASVILLGLITIVIAQGGVGEGDIINQAQLDSINATTVNLQCQLEDIGQSHTIEVGGTWYYFRNVSCLNIQPIVIDQDTFEYLIIRPNHLPYFFVSEYFQCVEENNNSFCNQFYTGVLQEQHNSSKLAIRNKIEYYQTTDGNSEDSDYDGEIDL